MDETFYDRVVRIAADIRLPSNFKLKIGIEVLPPVSDEEVEAACEAYYNAEVGLIAYRNQMRSALEAARKHQPPRYYYQIKCYREDAIEPGVWDWGYGGKATLSPHATDSELVQTVFGLYKGYCEHEARETFQWRDRRVFGPHMKIEALHSVARKIEVRSAMHTVDKEE